MKTTFASPATLQLIKQRDKAMEKAKATMDDDDIRDFKHLQNRTHRELTKDKETKHTKKLAEAAEDDPKTQWKEMKGVLGWKRSTTPKVIVDSGKTITSLAEIAKVINREQITKNLRLHRNIPVTMTDPLDNYRKLMFEKKIQIQPKINNNA